MKALKHILTDSDVLATKVSGDTLVEALTCHSNAAPKSVFFAIRGTSRDGHHYIEQALKNGAVAIVVEKKEVYLNYPNTILVGSSRQTLATAASRWFGTPSKELSLVGITGTNGKTTTAYLLKNLWTKLGFRSGIVGTADTYLGNRVAKASLTTPPPLELQAYFREMIENGVTHAALEVSSIALDQDRVTACEFDVGLFTNLSQDHLDYHGDMENYYQSKLKLFLDLPVPVGIFNIDDPCGKRLAKESRTENVLTFSFESPEADFFLKSSKFSRNISQGTVFTPEGPVILRTPLLGQHNLYNCLGVLAVCYAQGLDIKEVASLFCSTEGAPGRLERIAKREGRPDVFVDYAHSSAALASVLWHLRGVMHMGGSGRIITVFGCGGDRDKDKRPKMGKVVSQASDITIATSDNPRTEDRELIIDDIERGILPKTEYHREADRKKAIYLALSLAEPDDFVLVAGKGHETYQIIGERSYAFDDREVIRDYYRNL